MALNKIIYFDKETIRNILQEKNKGAKSTQTDISSAAAVSGDLSAEVSSKVKMEVPLLARLSFLFKVRIAMSYALTRDKTNTITMNEIWSKVAECPEVLSVAELYKAVSPTIQVAGENARTIKNKVQAAVETLLFQEVMDSSAET